MSRKLSKSETCVPCDNDDVRARSGGGQAGKKRKIQAVPKKPVVFVGSSTKGLNIASTVHMILAEDDKVEAHLWKDVFKSGDITLDALLAELKSCDYAVFILTTDDHITSRGNSYFCPRDNVIFETGLFMGRLGKDRTFLIYDKKNSPKLPSDLAGLTYISYTYQKTVNQDHIHELRDAVTKIKRKTGEYTLYDNPTVSKASLINSFIEFIMAETSPQATYLDIVTNHLDKICDEIKNLEQKEEWEPLMLIHQRLTDYFEFSGKYLKGVEMGKIFAHAYSELNQEDDAAWTRVKLVAYMLILAGKYIEAREEINSVLQKIANKKETDYIHKIRFYCYRFLGTSFQKDDSLRDLETAKKNYDKAKECLNQIKTNPKRRKELNARLLGNYGNYHYAKGVREKAKRNDKGETANFMKALGLYKKSNKEFQELGDREHIGIANLHIAETIIALGNRPGNNIASALDYLEKAEATFIEYGWIEGQGRVEEQIAVYYQAQAKISDKKAQRRQMLKEALVHADLSRATYGRVDNARKVGNIEQFTTNLNNSLLEEHGK